MTVDVKRVYEEVASDEGKILHAYLCSENHKTIGIGHKLLPSDPEIDLLYMVLMMKRLKKSAFQKDAVTNCSNRTYRLLLMVAVKFMTTGKSYHKKFNTF